MPPRKEERAPTEVAACSWSYSPLFSTTIPMGGESRGHSNRACDFHGRDCGVRDPRTGSESLSATVALPATIPISTIAISARPELPGPESESVPQSISEPISAAGPARDSASADRPAKARSERGQIGGQGQYQPGQAESSSSGRDSA